MFLAALALAQAVPPPSPPEFGQPRPINNVWSWNPADAITDGSANCGDCRITTARFIIDREFHTGFHLRPIDRPDDHLRITFATRRVEDQFYDRLGPENYTPEFMTRLVYCDCTGRRYETVPGGPVIFQISRARLFRPRD